MLRRFLLVVSSAILFSLGQPNEIFAFGLWPMGFIALIPLYLVAIQGPSHRETAMLGALYGGLQHALSSYWLMYYHGFAVWTFGGSTLAYALIYAVCALYLVFILQHSKGLRPIFFALFWTAGDYIKSIGFLGYPWGLIPYSMTSIPIMLQTADLGGVYGISFLLTFVNATIAEFFLPRGPQDSSDNTAAGQTWLRRVPSAGLMAAAAGLALIFAIAYGAKALATPLPQSATLRTLIIQQNTDPWTGGETASLTANTTMAKEAIATNNAQKQKPVDIVVFSESSLLRPYHEFYQWYAKNPPAQPLVPLIQESGAYFFVGAPIVHNWQTGEATNSVLLLDSQARLLQDYAKMHPVPFAEHIPFSQLPWVRFFMEKVVGIGTGWMQGSDYTIFRLDNSNISFGAPICFEDAFSELCRQFALRGADLFINLTNDSWSRTVSAQRQHWAVARLRSIELRRTMIRSTTAGVSSVIDAHGISIFELPQFEARAAIVDVPIQKSAHPTLFMRWGDWCAQLALGISALWFALLIVWQACAAPPKNQALTNKALP